MADLLQVNAVLPSLMEYVDGTLVEKTGGTLHHSLVQGNLSIEWLNFVKANQQKGKVLVSPPCATVEQIRRPDVAYMTAELLEQYGMPAILPESFPLIGEIASPDDKAEELFKGWEYLRSGCQEVWLLFPENAIVIIMTADKSLIFTEAETVSTQTILQGFSIPVAELFA
ncbi:MAG: Uma2 family endonuclease [Leptolyngbya sp. BL-A-14]